MSYVDGFVLSVPKENKAIYIRHSLKAEKVFKEDCLLSLVGCWGDDLPDGGVTSFQLAVKCEKNEVVFFSWMPWPSKKDEIRE